MGVTTKNTNGRPITAEEQENSTKLSLSAHRFEQELILLSPLFHHASRTDTRQRGVVPGWPQPHTPCHLSAAPLAAPSSARLSAFIPLPLRAKKKHKVRRQRLQLETILHLSCPCAPALSPSRAPRAARCVCPREALYSQKGCVITEFASRESSPPCAPVERRVRASLANAVEGGRPPLTTPRAVGRRCGRGAYRRRGAVPMPPCPHPTSSLSRAARPAEHWSSPPPPHTGARPPQPSA